MYAPKRRTKSPEPAPSPLAIDSNGRFILSLADLGERDLTGREVFTGVYLTDRRSQAHEEARGQRRGQHHEPRRSQIPQHTLGPILKLPQRPSAPLDALTECIVRLHVLPGATSRPNQQLPSGARHRRGFSISTPTRGSPPARQRTTSAQLLRLHELLAATEALKHHRQVMQRPLTATRGASLPSVLSRIARARRKRRSASSRRCGSPRSPSTIASCSTSPPASGACSPNSRYRWICDRTAKRGALPPRGALPAEVLQDHRQVAEATPPPDGACCPAPPRRWPAPRSRSPPSSSQLKPHRGS